MPVNRIIWSFNDYRSLPRYGTWVLPKKYVLAQVSGPLGATHWSSWNQKDSKMLFLWHAHTQCLVMVTFACMVLSYHVFCRTSTRPSVADLVALRGEGEAVVFQVIFGGVTPKQHIWLSAFTYKQAKKNMSHLSLSFYIYIYINVYVCIHTLTQNKAQR